MPKTDIEKSAEEINSTENLRMHAEKLVKLVECVDTYRAEQGCHCCVNCKTKDGFRKDFPE